MLPLALFWLACGGDAPTPPVPAAPMPPKAEVVPVNPALAHLEAGTLLLDTAAGPLRIRPVYHASTVIEAGGQVIWLDPWSKGALDALPKADLLLVTDIHADHMDPAAIDRVAKPGTVVVAPAAVAAALEGRKVDHVLANGETLTLGAITVTAEPMYNLVRGPEGGGLFHDKGRGDGFILGFGGKRIYFAGDTECTPELEQLAGIDVAFLPMNLPYTMTPEEAAACVNAMQPAVVVPYHYAGSDLALFRAAVKGPLVLELDYYPGGLPW